jgi:hypothetical protein
MISETYDIREFLTAMVGRDWHEIMITAQGECATAEARSYSVRGAPKARKLGSTRYASQLKAFLYVMNFRSRPGSASYGGNEPFETASLKAWRFCLIKGFRLRR